MNHKPKHNGGIRQWPMHPIQTKNYLKLHPDGAVGQDVMSIAYFTGSSGGDALGGGAISNNPASLVLGEKYEHAAGSLIIRQPVATIAFDSAKTLSAAAAADATTVTVSSAADIENNQYIAIDHGTVNSDVRGYRAYKVSSQSGTTLTLSTGLKWAASSGASVRLALETEVAARRKLQGLIGTGGLYIEYFTTSWEDSHFGTANKVAFTQRTHVDAWTYDPA